MASSPKAVQTSYHSWPFQRILITVWPIIWECQGGCFGKDEVQGFALLSQRKSFCNLMKSGLRVFECTEHNHLCKKAFEMWLCPDSASLFYYSKGEGQLNRTSLSKERRTPPLVEVVVMDILLLKPVLPSGTKTCLTVVITAPAEMPYDSRVSSAFNTRPRNTEYSQGALKPSNLQDANPSGFFISAMSGTSKLVEA